MALLNQTIQVSGQLGKLLEKLRQGQAPSKFTREFLKDLGFGSSNHHAFIPLLKGLGFLTPDGSPTQRYRDFLDPTRSSKIIAEALNEAYGDIFTIKSRPTKTDRKMIAGKFKSTYNLSEVAADRAAATFLALLDLADSDALYNKQATPVAASQAEETSSVALSSVVPATPSAQPVPGSQTRDLRLHYNIQIHLPATKDLEVYNAIFKSMREHLLD
ncbi:hypothetical protein SAMN05444161_6422 [Rhizobiales bacterium GAS191]|nr:hypothetical protein SAMN05444161_6422 [Rhizobiales bacterium GAS191]